MSANFASAEDTILSKLEWYRMGGELELDYMHKWAHELKVSDLLERALRESA